jgi:hypothetical protein
VAPRLTGNGRRLGTTSNLSRVDALHIIDILSSYWLVRKMEDIRWHIHGALSTHRPGRVLIERVRENEQRANLALRYA